MAAPSSSRVSIPTNLRKTIQNLKEIVKNHTDDEIYAMLRDCFMDPNETAQKLLLQEPFHEVKRKREKKKDNNRESVDTRQRSASQGRGGEGGGRGNFSARSTSHDAGGERNINKENGVHHATDKGNISSSSAPSQDTKIKTTLPISSSLGGLSNGPAKIENNVKENPAIETNKTETPPVGDSEGSRIYAFASDPVLVPSLDGKTRGTVSTIKREVGIQRTDTETTVNNIISRGMSSSVGKRSAAMSRSYMHGKMQRKLQGLGANHFVDVSQATSSLSRTSSAGSRPSSNYNNHSQQPNGSQKAVAPTKEWKPKSTNVKTAPVLTKVRTSDVELTKQDTATACTLPTSEESTLTLQRNLAELQFLDTKHVIIPNHLQVSESERTGLNFGTFDANFGVAASFVNDTASGNGSTKLSESSHESSQEPSQEIEENTENFTLSNQNAPPTAQEAVYADQTPSPVNVPENLTSSGDHPQSPVEMPEDLTSREPNVSLSIPTVPEYEKSEAAPVPGISQYSVLHTAPTYPNFGLVPQIIGNKFASVEGIESQAWEATRTANVIVQQPLHPVTNYYTSMYRPTTGDGECGFSPFVTPAGSTKYAGNIAVLAAQTGQTPQESGNSIVLLPSTGQAPLVTQASGAMRSSVTLSEQPFPLFRQIPGGHISHYPPTFHPYGQYFSPMYLPSPSIHPFLSNTTFPQHLPTGNVYSTPGSVGTANMKYPISQYKPTNDPSLIGMHTSYGTYNPSAVTSGSSTGSEDYTSSQYKENNVYIAGQQGEGSVWIPAPGRDISSVQPSSYYNLPSQGQPMAFSGLYHHPIQTVPAATVHPMLQQSQTMAGSVEMVGPPTGGVYEQPQCTQFHWVQNH